MTADSTPIPSPAISEPAVEPDAPDKRSRRRRDAGAIPSRRERSVPHAGWMVVASKEFADHLLSARFFVLLAILGLAGGIPIFLATEKVRDLASQLPPGVSGLFVGLFIIGPTDVSIFQIDVTVQSFITLSAPLLGLAFAFDAINGERAQGTLPRLLSQPIHRDDVINGKFAAGLAIIAFVLAIVVAVISAFGILRLGIAPTASEVLRLIVWFVVTVMYVGLWLSFGLLLSILFRGASTSALVGFGSWLMVAVFGNFLVTLVLRFLVPTTQALTDSNLAAVQLNGFILRLLPTTLYNEVSRVLLNPSATYASTPPTIGQNVQVSQQINSVLSLDQSFIIVWPQIAVLFAIMLAFFAIAYVRFMRQEVRA
jgi:ABC-2 type transport system permease protein